MKSKLFVIQILSLTFLFSGCGSDNSVDETTTETIEVTTEQTTEQTTTTETTTKVETAAKTIDYEIKLVDDTSIGNAVRKNLRILVNNPDDVKQEDFEKMCQDIVEEYTSITPVNALTLFFYDNERDIEGGYTFGMCTYYPNGDIGEAMNIQTGDYSNFKYDYTFKERNIAEKPTDKEFEIYDYLMDLLMKTDESEIECNKKTAERFNITTDEVNDIYIKVSVYKLPY